MNSALLSSEKMDWCTPKAFFNELDAEFHFCLDAAATDKTAICPTYYTPREDALLLSWDKGGAVFCNPPYGREIGKWVKKAHDEAQRGLTVVLLIPARTDTSYFHEYIYGKAEIRFVRGRLKFTDDDGKVFAPAPFPSMVVVYNGWVSRLKGLSMTSTIAWHETSSNLPQESGKYLSAWSDGYITSLTFEESYDHENQWLDWEEGEILLEPPDFWADLPAPPTKGE